MEMNEVKVGMFVKLPNDLETKYLVLEKNPQTRLITIKKFNSDDFTTIKPSKIEPWKK
ncbi:MAG: hypothetical protein WCK18_10000 [Prolixibacteraceae bacterium]